MSGAQRGEARVAAAAPALDAGPAAATSEPATEPPLEYLERDGAPRLAYRRLAATGGRPSSAEPPAAGARIAGVVFLHGFMSDMQGQKALAVEALCRRRGLACVRFDYRGHGRSGGRVEDGSVGRWLDDVLAVIDGLTSGPQLLVGSSLGGWLMTLAALARPQRAAGLVGVAVALDFVRTLREEIGEAGRRALDEHGIHRIPTPYGGDGYPITRELIDDGLRHCLLGAAIPFTGPVRLLHGMRDADVPWRNSLAAAAAFDSDDVVVECVKDGDHRLSRPVDIARLCRAVEDVLDLT
ncbi:MAG: alpha/beta hydrolase [Pseudomonadota bacterium]